MTGSRLRIRGRGPVCLLFGRPSVAIGQGLKERTERKQSVTAK